MRSTDFYKIIQDHKSEAITGAIAAVVLLFNAPNLAGFVASSNQLREQLKGEQSTQQRMQAEQMVFDGRREIAEARYRNGCEMIFSLNQAGHYTALTEGEPVLKGELARQFRGKKIDFDRLPPSNFLPAGMTVCDALGNTAILKQDPTRNNLPTIRDLASTGNQELIAAAKKKAPGIRTNSIY